MESEEQSKPASREESSEAVAALPNLEEGPKDEEIAKEAEEQIEPTSEKEVPPSPAVPIVPDTQEISQAPEEAEKEKDEQTEPTSEKEVPPSPAVPIIPDTEAILQAPEEAEKEKDEQTELTSEKEVPPSPAIPIIPDTLTISQAPDEAEKDEDQKKEKDEGKSDAGEKEGTPEAESAEELGKSVEEEKKEDVEKNISLEDVSGTPPEVDKILSTEGTELSAHSGASQEDIKSYASQSDHAEEEKPTEIVCSAEVESSKEEIQKPASEEGTDTDKSKKSSKTATSSIANMSRFLKSKRDAGKTKEVTHSGDEGEGVSTEEDESGKEKKKKGAIAHVSRFLGKAIKKEKEKEPDIFADLGLPTKKRDSDEMSYSEEVEEIPPEMLRCVAMTKVDIQKIREIVHQISKSLNVRPRIVTYNMVKESKELKQLIATLIQKIPDNVITLNLLESDESKAKCKQIWRVIEQELDAMNILAEAIQENLKKRRV